RRVLFRSRLREMARKVEEAERIRAEAETTVALARRQAAEARKKAEALEEELKRVRGRAEANHRVYLVAKGEADVWKTKYATLEAKWNELWRELEGIGWKPRQAEEGEAEATAERARKRRSRRQIGRASCR